MSITRRHDILKDEKLILPFISYKDKIIKYLKKIEKLEYVVAQYFRKKAYLEEQLPRLEKHPSSVRDIMIGFREFHRFSLNPYSEKTLEDNYHSLFHSAAHLYQTPNECIAEYKARIERLRQTICKLNSENIILLKKIAEIGTSSFTVPAVLTSFVNTSIACDSINLAMIFKHLKSN